jgi:hypothetical protein
MKLSKSAYEHAQSLIKAGNRVRDSRDDWSEHQPTPRDENRFIEQHGYDEYGRWHLGVDEEKPADTKGHYKFPYGDLHDVHRCAVLSAESRAGQYDYDEIELAAAHLHGMLEAAP